MTKINFGNVMIDSTQTQNISIQNYGTSDLIITSTSVSNPVYTISVSFPITITPGQIENIPVEFKPTANTVYNDSILIYHNDPIVNYSKVTVTGNGVYTAPYLIADPVSIAFGAKRINSTGYIELELSNAGSNILTVDSVKLNSSFFYFENLTTHEEFPVKHYIDFLNYVKTKYEGEYWNPLPREVAEYYSSKTNKSVKS